MPGEKSLQHKLDRVRPPRVQITYDVETNGAQVSKELPFVLGVMSDLAGHVDPDKDQKPLNERYFTEINRDSFNAVMSGIGPRLSLRVDNELQKDGTKLGVVLDFKKIDDFEPENVVNKVEPLRRLLEVRQKLADLKRKVGENEKLDTVLQKIIQTTEELKKRSGESAAASGSKTTGEA